MCRRSRKSYIIVFPASGVTPLTLSCTEIYYGDLRKSTWPGLAPPRAPRSMFGKLLACSGRGGFPYVLLVLVEMYTQSKL